MPVTNRINDKIIKNNGGTFTIKSQTITSLQRQLKDAHRSSPILMSFVAGGLASIGLSTNSATTIIGSMLLSPIGSLINKSNIYWLLNNNGIRMKEKYSHWILPLLMVVSITIGISYLLGTIFSSMKNPFNNKMLNENWPTQEMKDRSEPINAIYMIFIALLCGIALPISIIMESGVRFVAIGIATALIPPLANIGLALSYKKSDRIDPAYGLTYKEKAILVGASIFLINTVLLYFPSKYLLRIFVRNHNIFKKIEKIFNII
jgi:uncharacterized membrane protein